MLLTDSQIVQLCTGDDPMLAPFMNCKIRNDSEGIEIPSYGLSHTGYDIRLGNVLKVPRRSGLRLLDPMNASDAPFETVTLAHEDIFILEPRTFVLGVSVEEFCMPGDVTAVFVGKSTYARCGVNVLMTPAEPGWRGFLTLEIANIGVNPVALHVGAGISQALFFKHAGSNSVYTGKYQDQGPEPTLSK